MTQAQQLPEGMDYYRVFYWTHNCEDFNWEVIKAYSEENAIDYFGNAYWYGMADREPRCVSHARPE